MLALKVEYITGVCMATRHNDPSRSSPEWPPHPDRLYSALVAAAAQLPATDRGGIPEDACQALHWLAHLGPPDLAAPEARRRSAPDVHMPSNPHEDEVWQKPKKGRPRTPKKGFDLETLLPVHRKRTALPIPAVIPDEPAVCFIWPDAVPNGHSDVLREICGRVTYLGRSRSLVKVSLLSEAPSATHVPDPLGQVQLRVPEPNRLQYLIDNYQRKGGKPEPSPPHRYRHVQDKPHEPEPSESVFGRCYIFRPQPGDPLLPAETTVKVTQALRAALIACIDKCDLQVPDVVHGHGEHPHCGYVSLPFVHPWQRHADGTIKGLAVLVPREVPTETLQRMAAGLVRLQESGLGIPGVGTWHLTEVPADNPPMQTLDARAWVKASRVWTTVTPMVFGHFPKRNNGGHAKVVADSLEMIGIPSQRIVEIAVDRHSPLHGVPPSWCFGRRRAKGRGSARSRLMLHVTVRFDRPVRGPLVLGCMRYFGLGLMRPLEE